MCLLWSRVNPVMRSPCLAPKLLHLRHGAPLLILWTQGQTACSRLASSTAKAGKPTPRTMVRKETDDEEPWKAQKAALEAKFGETGWQPRKRLSPGAMDGIRALHAQDPKFYSLSYLAKQFQVSPEAIRRILKSKWQPTPEEALKRNERWERRGQSVWERWAALGYKPPKKWRDAIEEKNAEADTCRHGEVQTGSKKRNLKAGANPLLASRIL